MREVAHQAVRSGTEAMQASGKGSLAASHA